MPSAMTIGALLSSTPVQISVLLGFCTLAVAIYFSLFRSGSKKSKRPVVVSFFSDPSGNKNSTAAPEFKNLVLISKTHDTHDTIVLRFALPHHGRCLADGSCGFAPSAGSLDKVSGRKVINIAGIAPAKHVQIRATINGESVQRSFSPTSCAVDEAHCGLLDLHIKVYRPNPAKSLSGGVMSCYLDSLPIGSTVEMRGPTGLVQYAGNGAFLVGTGTPNKPRKVVAGKHLVLIAGGSGITPIIAVLKAILHGKLGGMRVPAKASSIVELTSPLSPTTQSVSAPLARREYLKGECRHSFYEYSETTLDESSNAVERITLIYCNHTISDVMFKDWLIGDDYEHSCYGAFAALAEEGSVEPAHQDVLKQVPDGFRAKAIDVSMNYFISRPTASDTKAMTAANKIWAECDAERWGLPARNAQLQTPRSSSAFRSRGRSNSKSDISLSPKMESLTSPISVPTSGSIANSTKASAIVTRRYAAGRLSEETLKECMSFGGEALATSEVRSKFAAEITSANVNGNDTVALLCGPPGLLNEVARPALLAAGVPKDKILLA